jgi:hypothetical protein
MNLDTAPSQFQKSPQSETLVRRILSVAEILSRSQQSKENENVSEKPSGSEMRYGDREKRTLDR